MLLTLLLFPFQYLTLELPKRIINDAIGASQSSFDLFGITLSQVQYLWLLCGIFLLAVLGFGLMKMQVNTFKGIVAERLLRRLRYLLVTRLFRFPKPYFQRTSQAEIATMVTAESEPLGGMMGDAIVQPLLQAGQMATILGFLFLQNVWFGLAAIAMIPVQAYVIPILQRQVNRLNKSRIQEVRRLSGIISETATGASALRTSGGFRFRSSIVSQQLGTLFFIRLAIYKKKFFMKFLNNFLTQLTPFFFFSIGGYLVIQGSVSIGALVAALAAYKDLSSPWKELLTYYTAAHEMRQRWLLIIEKFTPSGMLEQSLVAPSEDAIPMLEGDIELSEVTAFDADGIAVIDKVSLSIPQGSLVAIQAPNADDRRALAELLTREMLPSIGRVSIGGQDLAALPQSTIGARIGWADSAPYVFSGSVEDNMMLSMKTQPSFAKDTGEHLQKHRQEAGLSGNLQFVPEDNWIDPSLAQLRDLDDIHAWWMTMVEAMGVDGSIMLRGLGLQISSADAPDIAEKLVELREQVASQLAESALAKSVQRFDYAKYHTGVPLLHNILYGTPIAPISLADLIEHPDLMDLMAHQAIKDDILTFSLKLIDDLFSTFGDDGTDHPLFVRLAIGKTNYERALRAVATAKSKGFEKLSELELRTLLAFPCLVEPDKISTPIPIALQAKVIEQRAILSEASDLFAGTFQRHDPEQFSDGLTVLENLLYGTLDRSSGQRADALLNQVSKICDAANLKSDIARLTLQEETTFGGSNLPTSITERLAFTRAAIKRPNIFVLNKALASYDQTIRLAASRRLREELPEATLIYLEESFESPENFDIYLQFQDGKFINDAMPQPKDKEEQMEPPDLASKLLSLEQTEFFGSLGRKQLRLLAFSAQWFEIPAGEMVFEKGDDPSDGAYLILGGEADFIDPRPEGDKVIRTLGAGVLVGELALVQNMPRSLSMRVRSDLRGLQISGADFLAVVQNDSAASFALLRSISDYLSVVPKN